MPHGQKMTSPLPRRTLFVDERGAGLRVTWHADRGFVVLSLWHDDVCAATVRLPTDEAARLASFIVGHLGELAGNAEDSGEQPEDVTTREL